MNNVLDLENSEINVVIFIPMKKPSSEEKCSFDVLLLKHLSIYAP